MRIAESIVALWSPRQPDAPAGTRPHRGEERRADVPPAAAQIYVLDIDHDGWIDEDDLPYDQLLLLERARAAEAPAPDPAPPAAEREAPRVDLLA